MPADENGQVLRKMTFTNTASQMANPGTLPAFFANQNTANSMPLSDLPNQEIPKQVVPSEGLGAFFDKQEESKLVRFRTGSMRAWNVPLGMTEVRATDFT